MILYLVLILKWMKYRNIISYKRNKILGKYIIEGYKTSLKEEKIE